MVGLGSECCRGEDGEQVAVLEASDADWLTALAFSPDGEILAAGHYDGRVCLWRTADGSLLRSLESATDYCKATRLAFCPTVARWPSPVHGRTRIAASRSGPLQKGVGTAVTSTGSCWVFRRRGGRWLLRPTVAG